jgi:prepilin-type N-terminal cleavage/methylation domain-containing protein
MRRLYDVKKGFTLVEILIVIAIIGILASVILSSLNDARVSGIEAKIKGEMDSLRKSASISESQTLTYDTVCGTNGHLQDAKIIDIIAAIDTFASGTATCNSSAGSFAVSVPLGGLHWCVDNLGISREIPAALITSPLELSCP